MNVSESRERAESEHFRELSLEILALSGAEIWSFECKKSGFLINVAKKVKTSIFYTKKVISRLRIRLKPSMKALLKAQILLFNLVLSDF